jgi:HEAT repeat protein
MNRLLRDLDFSWFSFLLGLLAGGLVWWLIGKLRPTFERMRSNVSTETRTIRQEQATTGEVRLGNDILRVAQGMHIAAPLFSLEEVLISPRLLPPPQVPIPGSEVIPAIDITDWTIPYLPDWPQFASHYNAPSMTIAEALQGDANLVVVGSPGSGKTVALAQLAIQAVKHDPALGELAGAFPLLVRAADLLLPAGSPEEILVPLVAAVNVYAESKTAARLPALLSAAFEVGPVFLIVDGLDELPPNEFDQIVHYLEILLEIYPKARLVASASPEYLGRLTALDFMPMVLAYWNQEQRAEYLMRWGSLWSQFIAPESSEPVDPLLIHGWLLNTSDWLTPLELTLKAWAAYAGDVLGPRSVDAIEAYVRRMTCEQPPKNRPAFEQLCAQIVLTMQASAPQRSANRWLAGGGAEVPKEALEPFDDADQLEFETGRTAQKRVRAPGALTDLIESGLVFENPGERVSVVHPVITGYLASQALTGTEAAGQLLTQPYWSGQLLTLQYLAAQDSQAPWINQMLVDEQTDPLLKGLLVAARWLKGAPEKAFWASNLMRVLAASLQKDELPLGLKARIASALVSSGDSGVAVLLRQMLDSPRAELRQFAVLGIGMLRDTKSVPQVSKLVDDRSRPVNHAAILALVSIGSKDSLDAVASALLHGDERLRQAAAEGLANHPEEGYPALKEGSELEDHNVRRAAVYGLARIRQPWATEILERLRNLDNQWAVQDAAADLLRELENPDARLPNRHPALTHTPWLIEFAGRRGVGVAPGRPAYDLLYSALKDGGEGEKLAALYYLCYYGDESSLMPLYQVYYSSRGEIREAALNTLWHLSASGVRLPPPAKYGLK